MKQDTWFDNIRALYIPAHADSIVMCAVRHFHQAGRDTQGSLLLNSYHGHETAHAEDLKSHVHTAHAPVVTGRAGMTLHAGFGSPRLETHTEQVSCCKELVQARVEAE